MAAHDPQHCAVVQQADVARLASAALASVELAAKMPTLAGSLFGVLAKVLQAGNAAAQQCLRQQPLLQLLLQGLARYMCCLHEEDLAEGPAFASGQELSGRLLELLRSGAAAADSSGDDDSSYDSSSEQEGPAARASSQGGGGSGGQLEQSGPEEEPVAQAAGSLPPTGPARIALLEPHAAGAGSRPTDATSGSQGQQGVPLVQHLHRLMALRSAAAALQLGDTNTSISMVESIALGTAAEEAAAGPAPSTAALLHLSDALTAQARCAELQLALQRNEQRASQLVQESQELRADKEQLRQEAQQLKREQQLMQQLLEQQRQEATRGPTAATAAAAAQAAAAAGPAAAAAAQAAAGEWDELADPLMAASSQQEVSPAAARGFVSRLQAARHGCRQMRKAFCSMLKHLSTGLYSNSEHLMHELIQNAEDAHVQAAAGAGGCALLGAWAGWSAVVCTVLHVPRATVHCHKVQQSACCMPETIPCIC